VAELGIDVEHRDRVRQSQRARAEPAEPPDDRLGHALRSQSADTLDRHGLRVLREGAKQLSEQQGVASGGVMAGPPEAGAGRLAEHRAGERDRDAVAEGSRSDDTAPGVARRSSSSTSCGDGSPRRRATSTHTGTSARRRAR
jgi:hypothetical protein